MPKVVLVVGAGAGAGEPLRFPIGATLIEDLSSSLNFRWSDTERALHRGDPDIYSQIGRDHDLFLAARELADGIVHFQSVDDYLYARGASKSIVLVGKVGIAATILKYERDCPLSGFGDGFTDRRDVLDLLRDTWLHKSLSFLLPRLRREQSHRLFEDLTIINFNYDRCVEQYLYYAIQAANGLDENEARKAMAGLNIIHPYGKLGLLPWEVGTLPRVAFGASVGETALLELAASISTYTEQERDPEFRQSLMNALFTAERVAFLGFGFHPQNVRLLCGAENSGWPKAYATTLHTSPHTQALMRTQIANITGARFNEVQFHEGVCGTFMDHFGPPLFRD